MYGKVRTDRTGYGYKYYERDAICNKCGVVLGSQRAYNEYKEPKEEEFVFEEREKNNYDYCPYCGEQLYEIPLYKRGR